MSGRGAALVARGRLPDSSFPNPVRLVVSSIPQTSSICEWSALRDSFRQKHGPSARGVPHDLSGATFAAWKRKWPHDEQSGTLGYARYE